MRAKHFALAVCFLMLFFTPTLELGASTANTSLPDHYDLAAIEERVRNMDISLESRFNSTVKSYIKSYVVQNRRKSEMIVGKSSMYFPIFEYYLNEYGLPNDLKYVSVVESALDPVAVSRSGAVGLWQFMKGTGKEYGLKIDKYIDERKDPEKATEAAVQYMAYLYKKFGDWALALAAYNCGPGRLSKAIKKAGSNNYWKLQKYLPKETRNYVPAFIAANYLMNYYYHHDIEPMNVKPELMNTMSTMVHNKTSFQEISLLSGVSVDDISALNPMYSKRLIPKDEHGMNLKLPIYGMSNYNSALRIPDSMKSLMVSEARIAAPDEFEYFEAIAEKSYKVRSGDNLYNLARHYDCKVSDIKNWNNLRSDRLQIGQELKIMQTERLYVQRTLLPTFTSIKYDVKPVMLKKESSRPVVSKEEVELLKKLWIPEKQDSKYSYHLVKRSESLFDIASLYQISIEELKRINSFDKYKQPKPGMKIKIQKL